MKTIRNTFSVHVRAVALSILLIFAITVPTTGCALYCSVFTCKDTPTDYTTVTAKALGATNVAAKTAMSILKHELVPSGKVSKETEAKIVEVYEKYVTAGQLTVDLLIVNNVTDANEAFIQLKAIFQNLLVLLRSVGVFDSTTISPEEKKLLVPYPADSYLVVEKGK